MITYRSPAISMLFVVLLGGPVCAWAQDPHEEQHHRREQTRESQGTNAGKHQDAHVHGTAELFVVLEGAQLNIELQSPAMNLLGFEHRARTPEQRAQVKHIKDTLNTNKLFTFGSAQCQLVDHDVNVNRVLDKSFHDDSDHHDEGHDHNDIDAGYRYRCEQPNNLDSLATSIPTEFPGIESLQVQWIVNGRQGATALNKNRRQITFR